mgnify:CR=1 FL=1
MSEKYNINANYSIINIQDDELPKLTKQIRDKELSGINITLPYKQRIVSHLDILVNDAEITSSVNTVYLDKNESLIGENTPTNFLVCLIKMACFLLKTSRLEKTLKAPIKQC